MLFLKPEHGSCGSSETPSSARNARISQPWLGRAHQRDRGCTGAMVDRRPRRQPVPRLRAGLKRYAPIYLHDHHPRT